VKFIRKIFIIIIIAITVLIASLLGFSYFKSDALKQEIVSQLNQYLEVEVSVGKIDLNVIKQFPYITVGFQNVAAKGKYPDENEKLINAAEISVLFNIVELIQGKYILKKIIIKNAFLNIITHPDGKTNYQIIKTVDRSESSSFKMDLTHVSFHNVSVSYAHYPSNQEYLFRINKGTLKGAFSKSNQTFDFHGDLFTTHIKSGSKSYLNNSEVLLDLNMEVDRNNKVVQIKNGEIKTNGLKFSVLGKIETHDKKPQLDLTIESHKAKLETLLKTIPQAFLEPVQHYHLKGLIKTSAQIKGAFAGNQVPRILISFVVENGEFIYPAKKMELNNIHFTGSFDNGNLHKKESYQLLIKDAQVQLKGGLLSGQLSIHNFIKPIVSVEFSTKFNLENLPDYFRIDTLKKINGTLEIEMKFKNQLQNFRRFMVKDFITSSTQGTMKLSNMNFELINSLHHFLNFNGSFRFNNKDLEIDHFSGDVSGTDFQLKGAFQNILAYAFTQTEPVFIDADLKCNKMDLGNLIPKSETKKNSNGLHFSDRINYQINFRVNEFNFRKFSATHITGNIKQNNRIVSISRASFQSMDGTVNLSGKINGRNPVNHLISCNATIQNVNIQKLFADFGNFGQENLTDRHIRGTVAAEIEYNSTLSPFLKVSSGSVYTLADITISDGELINYSPLLKLSKYIKEEELRHVRFSNLKNQVRIQNEVVHIPQMDIESSSLNINLFGNHNFNNQIDYHIQLLAAEILVKKTRIKEDIGDNFVNDDGLGKTKLYLRLTGDANNPVVKFDSREVSKKIANELKEEKETFKKVIRDEFKLKSKEKEEIQPKLIEAENQQNFIIDWEKDSTQTLPPINKKVKPDTNKTKEKEFIIIWDEEEDTLKVPRI
jgi:hypothetical protein